MIMRICLFIMMMMMMVMMMMMMMMMKGDPTHADLPRVASSRGTSTEDGQAGSATQVHIKANTRI